MRPSSRFRGGASGVASPNTNNMSILSTSTANNQPDERGASPGMNVSASPSLSVPWNLRRSAKLDASESCWCLSSRYLLSRVEFTFRVALIAALPVAIMLATESSAKIFITKSFGTTVAVALASPTIGSCIRISADVLKTYIVWLPIATLMAVVNVGAHEVWWWIAYCGFSFLIGLLCEGFCRKVTLLFYNLVMLAIHGGAGVDYPARLCIDSMIGSVFGMLASMLPPFRTSTKKATGCLEQIFDDISICFCGLSEGFWMPTNLTRSVDLKKIQFISSQIEELCQLAAIYIEEAEYEQFGASMTIQDLKMRLSLCKELQYSLHSMQRAVEIVETTPDIIETDDAQQFRAFLTEPLANVATAADNLLRTVSRPSEASDFCHLEDAAGHTSYRHFNMKFASTSEAAAVSARCGNEQFALLQLLDRQKESEETFRHSRAELYRNQKLSKVDEYHQPMGFFMFHHRLFTKTLAKFIEDRREWESKARQDGCGGLVARLCAYMTSSLFFTLAKMKRIITQPNGEVELRIIKEAFKTALALTLGTLFFLEYEPDNTAISGPAIIALVSGANTGEALHASLMRLIGTVFGAVFGFFATSIATNKVEYVIGVVSVVFILSFFRTGAKYGGAGFYACFVAVATMVPDVTTDATMRRVQQNTFGVVIYVAIAAGLFPATPSVMLSKARQRSLKQISMSMIKMAERFSFFKEARQQRVEPHTTPEDEQATTNTVSCHGKWLDSCKEQLNSVMKHLNTERSTIPLAEVEPSLKRRPFPSALAKEFFETELKMATLHQTMLAAWTGILLEAEDGDDQSVTKSTLATLSDTVHEFVAGVAETINMITVLITEPHANLTLELTQCTLHIRQLAQDILKKQQRAFVDMANAVQSCAHSGITTPMAGGGVPRIHSDLDGGSFMPDGDHGGSDREKEEHHNDNDDQHDDANSSEPMHSSSGVLSPNVRLPQRKSPMLRSPMLQREGSRALFMIDDSELPISNFDVGALHCLTFSCVSIAYELRKLFVAAEALQQSDLASIAYYF